MAPSAWERIRYDLYAPIYDAVTARATREARARSLARLDLPPGARVLVLGAGTGLDLPHIRAEARVAALDLSPRMLARADRAARRLGRGADCVVGDGERLPFHDGAFDAVVLHLILAIVPDPVACAREAARVLRHGGRIVVFDKFLPDEGRPTALRRAANALARLIATDINRRLGPILEGAGLERVLEEPAPGLPSAFRVALVRPRATRPP